MPPQQPAYYPPPRRRLGLLVIGLVVGLIIGGGGVALGWSLTGGSTTSAAGPGAEAQAACLAIRGVQLPTRPQDLTLAEGDRWVGAAALAEAAGKGDGTYQQLSTALDKVGNGIEELNTNSAQVTAAAAQAQGICAATFH
jgi:hypothetical protein